MPVNPDSARDSGYFIYLVTVELGIKMDEHLQELERHFRAYAPYYRKIGLKIERDPGYVEQCAESEPLLVVQHMSIPERYCSGRAIKTKTGRKLCGLSNLERVIAIEQLAYGDAGVFLTAPGPSLSGVVLNELGSEEQKESFFSRFNDRPMWTFFALTEPERGSDATMIRTRLKAADEDKRFYSLSGEKYFIGNVLRASCGVVFARVAEGALGIEAVLVEKNDPVRFRAQPLETFGLRALQVSHLVFDGMPIPESQLLGQHLSKGQRGILAAVKMFNQRRTGVAACALGVAKAVMDLVSDERKTFNEKGKETISRLEYRLNSTRQVIRKAAEIADQDPQNGYYASLSKVMAVSLVEDVTTFAVQMLGPSAFLENPFLNKCYRDARGFEYLEGTSNMQKLNIFQHYMTGKVALA